MTTFLKTALYGLVALFCFFLVTKANASCFKQYVCDTSGCGYITICNADEQPYDIKYPSTDIYGTESYTPACSLQVINGELKQVCK